MEFGRLLPLWAAVVTMALLALLSPFAHACPSDPRLTASSADDLDDLVDLVLAGAATFARVPAILPPSDRRVGSIAEDGSGCTSAVPGGTCPTRAPPVLLARSF
jgi:hypothetical protein